MSVYQRSLAARFAAWLGALLGMAVLAACGRNQAASEPAGAAEVMVAVAVEREVQDIEEVTARLEAPDTVELRARVAGVVEKVHFTEGRQVRQGNLLMTIDPRPFMAEVAQREAQLASSRTQAELAASELARAERLLPIDGVSRQEVDQLRAGLANSRSAVRAAEAALTQARLNLEFTSIRAPISGRISRAHVTAGNLVGVGNPVLTTIVSSDRVYAYFDVREAVFLRHVQEVRASRMPVRMGLAHEAGFPHEGRLDFVDNQLNPVTATIRGRALFDNSHGHFTPGLFARVRLAGSARYPATLVPERAVTTDQTRKVVLAVGDDNVVRPREVRPGALIEGMRVVQGLQAGERVVVEGLHRALPGSKVTPRMLQMDVTGLPVKAPAPGAATLGS
ncbi:MAG: efflux RND transporter periplasmic adaptor subunit [Burkholderiaceae bacterium]|nr:efflux RND transporter periplasmic adaptor subunit [Burkholderiaceae bacterium]